MDDYDYEDELLSTPEEDEMILESLGEKKYQTLRHLSINTGLSADKIEPFLKTKSELVSSRMVGVLEVWFLHSNKPDGRLYNTGLNSFAVTYGTFEAAIPPKKRRKVKSSAGIRATMSDKLSLEDVEKWGFEGKTIREVAKLAGITVSSATFYLYSKEYPYRTAFQKGKKRRSELAERQATV
jgi:hypothetical protein